MGQPTHNIINLLCCSLRRSLLSTCIVSALCGRRRLTTRHKFVERAADFIPDAAVKQAETGLQSWWWDVRLPKWARHFEKALQANGGLCLVGQRCSYRQPTNPT